MSAPLRKFQDQAFGIGKAFTMSFEESDKFLSNIVKTVVASEDMKDTFISYPEMIKNAEAFTKLGLSIGYMNDTIDLGSRKMNLLATASLLSSAAISSYFTSKESAILSNQSALSAWLRPPHAG